MANKKGPPEFILDRLKALESENYDLRDRLARVSRERDDLIEKYNIILKDHSRMEDFMKKVGHKIAKFTSKRFVAISPFTADKLFSTSQTDIVDNGTVDESPNEIGLIENENADGTLLPLVGVPEEATSSKSSLTNKQLGAIDKLLGSSSNPEGNLVEQDLAFMDKDKGTIFNFDDMNLKEDLLRGIHESDCEALCNIEEISMIPALIKGQDAVVQDGCGPELGKFATLSILTLQHIDDTKTHCQALILVPYRELAQKIENIMNDIGKFMNVHPHVCIGRGTKVKQEKVLLTKGVSIVIGTPGRIYDMITRKCLRTDNISLFILDEADILVSEIFVDQTRKVLGELPSQRKMVFFTSTVTPELTAFCNACMINRSNLRIQEKIPNLDSVSQFYLTLGSNEMKERALLDIQDRFPGLRMVIFCNGLKKVRFLQQYLHNTKDSVLAVHANMNTAERETIIKEFCSGTTSTDTLITTDLPAIHSHDEKLQLDNVSLAVNFDLPANAEIYFSRISFCGPKLIKNGILVNFTVAGCPGQKDSIESFEKECATEIADLTD